MQHRLMKVETAVRRFLWSIQMQADNVFTASVSLISTLLSLRWASEKILHKTSLDQILGVKGRKGFLNHHAILVLCCLRRLNEQREQFGQL